MELYGIDISTFLFFSGLAWFLSEILITDNVQPLNENRLDDKEPIFSAYVHIRDYFRIFAVMMIIISIIIDFI